MANTWAPVGSPSYQHHPVVPVYDSEIPDYAPPSPTPSRESRRGRISQWFSRSRSPSRGGDDPREGGSRWGVRSRSRGRQSRSGSPMDTGSPSSFVVRNVVRQSGGVSGDESEGEQAAQSSKYRRTKSKPLSAGAAMSLGVPPGGPGGGTGYGTATSSNDGRPIFEERNRAHPSAFPQQESDADSSQGFPPPRPASPATTKASAFRQSRSPRRSPIRQSFGGTSFSETARPSASALREAYLKQLEDEEAAQNTDNDGASSIPPRTGSPTRSLIGGPRSLGAPAGGRPLHPAFAPAANNSQAVADSPDLGAIPGFDPASFQTSDSSSPLNVQRREAEQAASGMLAQGDTSGIADRLRGFFTGPSARSGLAVANGNDEGGRDFDDEGEQGEALPYGMPRQAFEQHQQQQRQPRRSNISGAFRKWSGQMSGQANAEDEQAEALRRRSRQEAARLVDEERRRVMAEGLPSHQHSAETPQTDSQPSEFAGRLAAEGRTADMLEQLTEQGRRDLVRRLTARSEASSRPASSAGDSAIEEIEAGCDNLTAAQRIIADTRERHLEEERRASTVTVMADETRGRQVSTPPREVPVRRRTSPKKKPPMQATASEANGEQENATARGPTQPSAMQSPTATPVPRKANAPGQGPLPMDFGPDAILPALQDMMTRFYRFERYCVPLLRTLDARYGEVQGAAQAQSVNNEWLEHVSTLMKHEIGQLRAAAGELHQGRQALDALVKLQQAQHSGSADPSPAATSAATAAAGKALDRPASPPARSNLALPAGAAPALDKDGSSGPTLSSENASRRMRSTSPNGRPKYTSALGQPLVEGRISPAPSQDVRERRASIAPSIAPSVAPSIPMIPSGVSLSIEADDDDSNEHQHQHQQQEAEQVVSQRHHSRNPSDASVGLSIHTQRAMARAAQAESLAQTTDAPGSTSSLEAPSIASPASPSRSVNDRLKALMGPRQSQRPQQQFQTVSPEMDAVNAERWSTAAAAPVTSQEEPRSRPHGAREGGYLRPASPQRPSSQAASPTASVQEAFVGGRISPAVGSYAGSAAQSSTRASSVAASAQSYAGEGSPALSDEPRLTSATANAAPTTYMAQASRGMQASTKSQFDSASSRSQDSYSSQSRVNGSRATSDRENNKPSSLRAGWTPPATQSKASPAFSGANKGTFAGVRPGMTMKERVAFFEIGNR